MKTLSTSRLIMIYLAPKLTTSSAKENESWPVNSLTVKGDKIESKNFAKLCVMRCAICYYLYNLKIVKNAPPMGVFHVF